MAIGALLHAALAVLEAMRGLSGVVYLPCELEPRITIVDSVQMLNDIIRREGGFVDRPDDRGGATNFGITQRAWSDYRLRKSPLLNHLPRTVDFLKEDHAREFYTEMYIKPAQWIHELYTRALFIDSAINHGMPRATRWIQMAVGVQPDGLVGPVTRAAVNSQPTQAYREMLRTRFRFYAQIATDQHEKEGGDPDAVFLRGWVNRACEFIR